MGHKLHRATDLAEALGPEALHVAASAKRLLGKGPCYSNRLFRRLMQEASVDSISRRPVREFPLERTPVDAKRRGCTGHVAAGVA